MKRNDIYIGVIGIVDDIELSNNTIMPIEEKKLSVYQYVCPLYKIDDNHYINLEWIYSPSRKLRILKALITKDYSDELIIGTEPLNIGDIFVVESSLRPYYEDNLNKVVSKRKIRNDMIMDVRIPGGMEITSDGHIIRYIRKDFPERKK